MSDGVRSAFEATFYEGEQRLSRRPLALFATGAGELFTENFLAPVVVVLARQAKVIDVVRLWAGTLVTNLAGGWLFMFFVIKAFPELHPVAVKVARHFPGWFEVLGSDTERVRSFYRDLFGWTLGGEMEAYALVDTGAGRGIPGGVGGSQEGSRWTTVYASVDAVETYLHRAEELGGGRVYGPTDIDDHMRAGALRDPAANVFGVYHHEPHG